MSGGSVWNTARPEKLETVVSPLPCRIISQDKTPLGATGDSAAVAVTQQKLTMKVHRARRVVAPVQHDHAGRHGLGAPSSVPAVTRCVVCLRRRTADAAADDPRSAPRLTQHSHTTDTARLTD